MPQQFADLVNSVSRAINGDTVSATRAEYNKQLLWSAWYYSTEQTKRLLDSGMCDVDARGAANATVLILSCKIGHDIKHDEIQLLIDYGADVNAKDERGRTALFWAAQHTTTEAAEILLNEDASPNIYDTKGHSLLDMIEAKGKHEMAELLRSHGATQCCGYASGEEARWATVFDAHDDAAAKALMHGVADAILYQQEHNEVTTIDMPEADATVTALPTQWWLEFKLFPSFN